MCAIDANEWAVATYKRNLANHVRRENITERTTLPPTDVIIGGPPCQGFSSAGMRHPHDKRNTLVRVFSELVARHRPRACVFENVEGFLTAGEGNRVFDLLEPLIEAGYRIHLRKVNAANYGVPQHRKRVIVIGGLGFDIAFPEPTHSAFGAPGASRTHNHLTACPTLADALDGLPGPAENPPGIPPGHFLRTLSEQDLKRIHLLKPGQTMRDLPVELWHNSYRRRAYRRVMDGTPSERRGGAPFGLRRLRGDEPSKAITSGAISEFVHPFEDRFLTLRECARIQTFPDDFTFVGPVGDVSLLIGNAVPPRFAEAIAESVSRNMLSHGSLGVREKGALVSFVPTNANGRSPALERICKRVEKTFVTYDAKEEQLESWF